MGIETILLTALQIGSSALQTRQQNKAISERNRAAAEDANLRIQELNRQREVEKEITQEKKADRRREADFQLGSLIATLSDGGGAGTSNAARLTQEVGFFEGLDLSRIEGNKRRKLQSLESQQRFTQTSALNTIRAGNAEKAANVGSFVGGALNTGFKAFRDSRRIEKAKQNKTTR